MDAYTELFELLSSEGVKGVNLGAVLPDESGPAVALPGVCRLTRVQGYGKPQHKPLLLIGTWCFLFHRIDGLFSIRAITLSGRQSSSSRAR
jgi:hypothetical protein